MMTKFLICGRWIVMLWTFNSRKMGMDYPLRRKVTPENIAIKFRGGVEGMKMIKRICQDWSQCWLMILTVNIYEVQPMSQFWRCMVDMSSVLSDHTTALDTAHTCIYFVEI